MEGHLVSPHWLVIPTSADYQVTLLAVIEFVSRFTKEIILNSCIDYLFGLTTLNTSVFAVLLAWSKLGVDAVSLLNFHFVNIL